LGSIRPGYVKIAARTLVQLYPDDFTDDFETNKRLVEQRIEGKTSKKVRNRVAGYLVRLVRTKATRERIAAAGPEEPVDMDM
jgi:small subunit ribosomal protein S17e